MEINQLGQNQVADLKPNSRTVPVTNANKGEYVRLVTQFKMTTDIKEQIEAFLGGFYEIIPKKLIAIFNEQEVRFPADISKWSLFC